ncbi:uncharacterized protein LOC131945813 [Physella acuta]|uniref:uncharacterized protein LOC131945813 n=1 Tax=Physella acuta TaxID=109671 RepID=UPI0027DBDD5E|nr:uncharacterized protein LOC131945813 [Physella acuta]
MILLVILVTLLEYVTSEPANLDCLKVQPPQPCNLQVIYPEPIGITTCDGDYTRGLQGAFDTRPRIKAAITKTPQKAFIVMLDRDAGSRIHLLDHPTVNRSCELVYSGQDSGFYSPPLPLMEPHHYVFLLFDSGSLDIKLEDIVSEGLCALIDKVGLGDPLAATQIRIKQNLISRDDTAPATKGEPLVCPLPAGESSGGSNPGPTPGSVGIYVIALLLYLL